MSHSTYHLSEIEKLLRDNQHISFDLNIYRRVISQKFSGFNHIIEKTTRLKSASTLNDALMMFNTEGNMHSFLVQYIAEYDKANKQV